MTIKPISAPLLPSTGYSDNLVSFVQHKLYFGLKGIILEL